MNLENEFRSHIDSYGLIVENPWEGGDTACEHFSALIICKWMNSRLFVDGKRSVTESYTDAASKLINIPSGLWRRHCAANPQGLLNYWAADWNRGTRDNGTSAFIATIVFDDKKTFMAMYRGFKKRWWFCGNTFPRNVWNNQKDHKRFGASWRQPFNPTPTVPDSALMLKAIAYRAPWVRKNTWLWDIPCCLIPALLIRRMTKNGTNDGNHLNAWLRIEFCNRRRPTWISRLAKRLLPKDIGLEIEFGDGSASARRNPPMHKLVSVYETYKNWDI